MGAEETKILQGGSASHPETEIEAVEWARKGLVRASRPERGLGVEGLG